MKMHTTGKIIPAVAAIAALMFNACGDDGSSNPSNGGNGKTQEYTTLADANACAPSRYGETVFITSEGEFYFCNGKRWIVIVDDDDNESSAAGSSADGISNSGNSQNGGADGSSGGEISGSGTSNEEGTSAAGGSQNGNSAEGSSDSGNAGQGESSGTATTSSSRAEGYVPHKPDILQWGSNYTTVTINDTVAFTLAYLVDANGVDDIKHYDWDFGDGATLRKSDSSFVKHAYAGAGSYTVSITVTDSNGDSTTKSLIVTVLNPMPVVEAGANRVCHNAMPCSFWGTASDPNSGSQTGIGTIVLYEWDYDGDGTFDEQKTTNSFSHVYPDTSASVRYVAKFCATDDDGNRVCDTATVDVSNGAPTLSGQIQISSIATNESVTFSPSALTCSDPNGNQRDSLWWDLNGDGVFETAKGKTESVTTSLPLQNDSVSVRCKDKWGLMSNAISKSYRRQFNVLLAPPAGTMLTYVSPEESATATMQTTLESFKASCTLLKFASEMGWGYVYSGLLYVLDGTSLSNATPVKGGNTIVIRVKAAAGRPLKIYGFDKTSYEGEEGIPKYSFVGNGVWQTVEAPATSFQTWSGANTFNPTHIYAIAVEYEYGAAVQGEPCARCSNTPLDLEWQSLEFR